MCTQLCLYEESYQTALREFSQAAALDPGWKVPQDKMADTRRFLQAMTHSVSLKAREQRDTWLQGTHTHSPLLSLPPPSLCHTHTHTQGRMKSKKSTALFASLSSPEKFTGSFSEDRSLSSVSELSEGSNTGRVFVGGVSAVIPTTDKIP